MDMDDKNHLFQIEPRTKILVPLVFFAVFGAFFSFYLYSSRLIPEDEIASAQFNRFSASMRHTFKVGSLNHKAFDVCLAAFHGQDEGLEGLVEEAIDFMRASLGFIHVGYIDNEELVARVVPIIEETISYVGENGLSVTDEEFEKIRNHFNSVFGELERIEKGIYFDVQKLYSRQLQTRKKWHYFYTLISVTAILGFLAITILAHRQRRLIHDLKENDQKLKVHIAERKQAENDKAKLTDRLHQAKKMETIGLMAGGVAHDLNNILSGIVGYPDLMLMKLPQESELRGPVEAIKDSGNRAVLVVDDLLTVARGAANIKENHSLASLVKEYLDSPEFMKLRSIYPLISFQQRFDVTQSWVFCSPVHVKKCIMNLVTNAAEAIEGEGDVIVLLSNQYPEESKSGESTANRDDEYVVVSVQDSGPGISSKDLKHIFDPFYSQKAMGRSGTGLGLTVVWNTIEDHNGKVVVENNESGTCFHLCFPLGNEQKMGRVQSEDCEKLAGNEEHVLVVDDDFQLRDLISRMLRQMGYTVDTVSSGEEALLFLKDTPVALIVLDMLMEPGMNGCQAYEEIVKIYPGQKAIIASGFSESEDVKKALQLGASQFIKKPFSIHQLSLAVKATLDG